MLNQLGDDSDAGGGGDVDAGGGSDAGGGGGDVDAGGGSDAGGGGGGSDTGSGSEAGGGGGDIGSTKIGSIGSLSASPEAVNVRFWRGLPSWVVALSTIV